MSHDPLGVHPNRVDKKKPSSSGELHQPLTAILLNSISIHPHLCHDAIFTKNVSGDVRVRFQVVKKPILGGFPLGNPTHKATASKIFKGNLFVRVQLGGVPSATEKVSEHGSFCLLG